MVTAIPEKVLNSIIASVPVKRLGRPGEIARLITFIADEQSGYITGADISINGGLHMS